MNMLWHVCKVMTGLIVFGAAATAQAQVPTRDRRPANAAEDRLNQQRDAQQDRRLARLEKIAAETKIAPAEIDKLARQFKLGEARTDAEFDAITDKLEIVLQQLAELRANVGGTAAPGAPTASQFEDALNAGRFEDAERIWARYETFLAERYAKQEWARFQALHAKDASEDKQASIAFLEAYVVYEPKPYNVDEAQALLTKLLIDREARAQQLKASTPWLAGTESSSITRKAGIFTAIAISPTNTLLLAGGDDGVVGLYRLSDRQLVRTFAGHSGKVHDVAFSPNGAEMVTAGSDGIVTVWNVASGKAVHILKAHYEGVNSARYTPDGQKIITASDDERILVWNARSGELVQTLLDESSCKKQRRAKERFIGSECNMVNWNPIKLFAEASQDGTRLLVRMRSISEQFSMQSGQYLGKPGAEGYWAHRAINVARYSGDGRFIFAENLVFPMGKIFDVKTNREICRMPTSQNAGRATSADFSDDGKVIAIGTEEAGVELYQSDCTHLASLTGHGLPVTGLDMSKDGRIVASIAHSTDVIIWRDISKTGVN